jgi:thioredoxin 1
MSLEVTNANIQEILENKESKELIVLDFWAPWCGPCRVLGPIIEALSIDEVNKDIAIGKVNVDENQELAAKYAVRSLPTVLFIKNGEVVDKLIGAVAQNVLQDKINSLK